MAGSLLALCLLSPATAQDWTTMSTTGAPAGFRYASAVWTGQVMIVWGGANSGSSPVNTGARYDPVTDTWSPVSTTGAPAARWQHGAVWTGTRMIVWGGNNGSPLNDGGQYDPVADTWTSLSTTGAPTGRRGFSTVWTGTELIIWGGGDGSTPSLDSGGRYNPLTNSWTATSLVNAPSTRAFHTAVWTGTEMLVWGGNSNGTTTLGVLDSGGRYDPVSDSWTATSLAGAPFARHDHGAAWTGSRMMIWGGIAPMNAPNLVTDTGGLYDPSSDQWTSTSLTAAPAPQASAGIVWTGNEIIVWAGFGGSGPPPAGGRYDPARDEWTPVNPGGAPSARQEFTAAWTGTEMIIWGGDDAKGGRYRPPPLTAMEADGSCLGAVSIAAPGGSGLSRIALAIALGLLLLGSPKRRRTPA